MWFGEKLAGSTRISFYLAIKFIVIGPGPKAVL
jgi:hypothetical protein